MSDTHVQTDQQSRTFMVGILDTDYILYYSATVRKPFFPTLELKHDSPFPTEYILSLIIIKCSQKLFLAKINVLLRGFFDWSDYQGPYTELTFQTCGIS